MVNQEVLQGRWSEVKGKLQERWGELTNDPGLRFEGDINRLVGHIHVKTGESREQIESYLEQLANDGGDGVRETVDRVSKAATQAAQQAYQRSQEAADAMSHAVQDGYQQTEAVVRKHPLESLAVCFGVGLLTGVIVGLTTMGSRQS